MAGHRKQLGRPPRGQQRRQRMRARLAAAATAEEQLSAAFDWFRIAVRHDAPAADRGRLMRDMAEALSRSAAAIEGGDSR